jgi:3-dehydroquinate dehydratase-1
VVEIRLDILSAENALHRSSWSHLGKVPILFTARREEEGGAISSTAAERSAWIELALDDAAAIDIEVASLEEMQAIRAVLKSRGVPLVASFHDFNGTPPLAIWQEKLEIARAAGAAVFKAAARIQQPSDLASLAEFQSVDHGLPVAMMGMGALAPVSRVLCAQYGSVLNYGYLGTVPTAPGQWSAARLKDAIAAVESVRDHSVTGVS